MYNRHDISLPPLSKFHLSATNYLTCISSPMINLPLSETLASLELAELWNNYSPEEGRNGSGAHSMFMKIIVIIRLENYQRES